MFSFASKSPTSTVSGISESINTSSDRKKLENLVSAVKLKSEGELEDKKLNDNEILQKLKNYGYKDGLDKKDMNKYVLDTFSLTPNYRYADAYAKGYKQGKEKAIFSTKYGGKSRRHRKGKKHSKKTHKRRHRK